MSDKLKLYSDIEKRTGSAAISADSSQNDPDFDLQFFPQRPKEENGEEFTLLVSEPKLGDLETTTTQRPLVTQSLSPLENREALSQLVSLYETAPLLKGEKDKSETKIMEKDKEMEKEKEEYMSEDMMVEESKKDTQTYNGIPPSITLKLAASKSPSKATSTAGKLPAISTFVKNSVDQMEMKSNFGTPGNGRAEEVKETLKQLLECNHDMMNTVQNQLATQTRLLETLMKLL